ESLSESASALSSGKIAPARSSRWLRPAIGIAVVTAALAAGAGLHPAMRPAAASPSFPPPPPRPRPIPHARLAAAGHAVVYSAQWEGKAAEVFSVSSPGQESRALGLGEAILLSVSAGDELALQLRPRLWTGQLHGTLARVPLSGGVPRELRENVQAAD